MNFIQCQYPYLRQIHCEDIGTHFEYRQPLNAPSNLYIITIVIITIVIIIIAIIIILLTLIDDDVPPFASLRLLSLFSLFLSGYEYFLRGGRKSRWELPQYQGF